jgi:microcystin degradation protein MlrC
MGRRVLIAEFMHETNTFSVQLTSETVFRNAHGVYLGNEVPQAFRGTRTSMGAAFEAADKFGWNLVHPVTAHANPSGRVTDAAFELFAGHIVDACDGVDGVLLHLHGAMATESSDDGEGELLARLRKRLGPDIPIVAVLDLHATLTQLMADNANALISYRTYPHIDHVRAHLAGGRACCKRRWPARSRPSAPSPVARSSMRSMAAARPRRPSRRCCVVAT